MSLMEGSPPLTLHINPEVTPVAVTKASPVPIHWVDKVRADLERDIALGVIEQVPVNTPVKWCSRMHVVGKKDGSCRRTVDLRPLNSTTAAQTHLTQSPITQVQKVPGNTWRTTMCAWNGYQLVPLAKDFRDATTFLTSFGRFRYLNNPQGQKVSGDAYTVRYNRILMNFQRWVCQVDYALVWDKKFENHIWHMLEFLELTGNNGITQNPEKFYFGEKELKFIGFQLTNDGFASSPAIVKSI